MKNETLHYWASQMLKIIHKVDDTIVGGFCGLGSEEGHFVSVEVALNLMQAFADHEDYLSMKEIGEDQHFIFPCGEMKHGLAIEFDENFLGERRLNWYEEK